MALVPFGLQWKISDCLSMSFEARMLHFILWKNPGAVHMDGADDAVTDKNEDFVTISQYFRSILDIVYSKRGTVVT